MSWFKKTAKTHSVDALILQALDKSQAVIEFEPTGTIIRANSNFLDVLGYELEEIQGQHHRLFVTEQEANSKAYQQFWQRLAEGEFIADEFRRISKSGDDVWIQASYNPVIDASGKVIKVVKFATDISASKLKSADADGQITAISRSQAVIEFDLNGTILHANEHFLNALGYQLEEIKGKHHKIFVDEATAKSEQYAQFWQRLRQGEYDSGEYLRFGKGGKEVWIQASYNPILDMNGDPFKVVKYASDVTEQKLAAKRAQESANLANALKICQANVMMADNDLNIVFVNDQVQKMLRRRADKIKAALPSFDVDKLVGTCVDDFHVKPAHQR